MKSLWKMSWKSDYSLVWHNGSSLVESHNSMKFEEAKAYSGKEEHRSFVLHLKLSVFPCPPASRNVPWDLAENI